MGSQLLSLEYQDKAGRTGTFSLYVDDSLAKDDAALLAIIQAHRNMSQANLIEASLQVPIDISGLTNPAAADTGSYDTVRDQAVLQEARIDNTGYLQVSVPAPIDGIFMTSGGYAGQDVNPAAAAVLAWETAIEGTGKMVTPQGGQVTFRKGWRKGQPHS